MANKTITQLDAAQSLNDNMVIAVQDTNNTYKITLADVKAYCGGGSGGDKYKVGDRVNDDSNNPVGTVSSIFTDGNGVRYAVVCLDAQYRSAGGQYSSSTTILHGLPAYTNQRVWSATETATTNTTAILNTSTSTACSHCRSKTFTIDGISYAGQFPNLPELINIFLNRTLINDNDPTASSHNTLIIPAAKETWSSTQSGVSYAFSIRGNGGVKENYSKSNDAFVIPVLEIPLED